MSDETRQASDAAILARASMELGGEAMIVRLCSHDLYYFFDATCLKSTDHDMLAILD